MATELKLWEIADELQTIVDQLIEREGEIDDDLERWLNSVRLAFDEKVEHIVMAIRSAEARARMVNDEIERLGRLAKPYENTAKSLRDYLYRVMSTSTVRKVSRPKGMAWIQKNGRPTVSFSGVPDALPEDLQRITIALDREAAVKKWQVGEPLPEGVEVTTGTHLRIK